MLCTWLLLLTEGEIRSTHHSACPIPTLVWICLGLSSDLNMQVTQNFSHLVL